MSRLSTTFDRLTSRAAFAAEDDATRAAVRACLTARLRAVPGIDTDDIRQVGALVALTLLDKYEPEAAARVALHQVRADAVRDAQDAGHNVEPDDDAQRTSVTARQSRPEDITEARPTDTPFAFLLVAAEALPDRAQGIIGATLEANSASDVRKAQPRHAHLKNGTAPALHTAATAAALGTPEAGRGRAAQRLAAEQRAALAALLANVEALHREEARQHAAALDTQAERQRRTEQARRLTNGSLTIREHIAALYPAPAQEAPEAAPAPLSRPIGSEPTALPLLRLYAAAERPTREPRKGRTYRALARAAQGRGMHAQGNAEPRRNGSGYTNEAPTLTHDERRQEATAALVPSPEQQTGEARNRGTHGDTLARLAEFDANRAARDERHEPGCSRRPGCGCAIAERVSRKGMTLDEPGTHRTSAEHDEHTGEKAREAYAKRDQQHAAGDAPRIAPLPAVASLLWDGTRAAAQPVTPEG